MSREKKIYADQDPNWEGKDLKYWKLGFPRWWNPVFWLTVIMFPIIAGDGEKVHRDLCVL